MRKVKFDEACKLLVGEKILGVEARRRDNPLAWGFSINLYGGRSITFLHKKTCCENVCYFETPPLIDATVESASHIVHHGTDAYLDHFEDQSDLFSLIINERYRLGIECKSTGCGIRPDFIIETDLVECIFGGA